MRHISLLPLAVAPLSFGVFAGSAEGALVASAGAAHRLQASKLGALVRAVEVPAVAQTGHIMPTAIPARSLFIIASIPVLARS